MTNALTGNIRSDQSQRSFLAWMLLAFALFGLLARVVYVFNPISNDYDVADEATYALIARSLLSGHLPYAETFDHKPIALYYIYAGFIQIFGYGYNALRVMPFFAIAAATGFIYLTARRNCATKNSLLVLAIALFMTTCTSFGNGGHVSNTEIIQMPLFAAWWWVALNFSPSGLLRPALLGIIAGMTTQVNYLGGSVLDAGTVLVLVWTWVEAFRLADLKFYFLQGLLALMGFIGVILITLWPLIATDQLGQYFGLQSALMGAYPAELTADKIIRGVVATLGSAGLAVLLLTTRRVVSGQWFDLNRHEGKILIQLLLMVILTLIPIVMTKRLYPHYFNLLVVPFALIFLFLLPKKNAAPPKIFIFAAGAFATILLLRGFWDVYFKDAREEFVHRNQTMNLARFIQKNTKPQDPVLLLSMDHRLYFMADVAPATKFFFRGEIFFDRFLAKLNSSPALEVEKAIDRRPKMVLYCNEANDAAAVREVLNRRLAQYTELNYTSSSECKDLKIYLRTVAS